MVGASGPAGTPFGKGHIVRKLLASLVATTLLAGCADYQEHDHMYGGWDRYDYNHPDPSYGGYEADRYYREDPQRYQERQIAHDERIYRGRDGRYYCRHSDGSTGLVVGAVAGGVLGNAIAPGGSELFGTVLGAVAGGVAGQAIDEGSMRCR
jgi:hypothetical protein